MIIRPAQENDLDTLCDLYIEFHEFHARHLPAFLQPLGEPGEQERQELRRAILELLNDADSTILAAEENYHIIGFAELHLKHPDLKDRAKTPIPYVHLQSLAVTRLFRRKCVGRRLLQAAEAWARVHGANELRLDIWEFSAGPLDFYKRLGYLTYRRSLVKNL